MSRAKLTKTIEDAIKDFAPDTSKLWRGHAADHIAKFIEDDAKEVVREVVADIEAEISSAIQDTLYSIKREHGIK